MCYEFLLQFIWLMALSMLIFHWRDMNEFAQVTCILCLVAGVWGSFFTIYIVYICASTPNY